MQKIVILGANSAIAKETARIWASQGKELFLVGRDAAKLEQLQGDLQVRGAKSVVTHVRDLAVTSQHEELFQSLEAHFSDYDTVFIAYGVLSDEKEAMESFESFAQDFQVNFLSVVSLLIYFANRFEEEAKAGKRRKIGVISSVAGDRGRGSNYAYGSAKAALSTYLAGLRGRLAEHSVQVLTIKPGFVDTPMTDSVPKNALFASPQKVGKGIARAFESNADVVYLPWFWRFIMLALKMIPEPLFKYLKI